MTVIRTQCCIVGAGPAGLMLGLLLARAGVTVTVLERHADFLRDYRGDTIHPSTLDVMAELGLLEKLLDIPHQQAAQLHAEIDGKPAVIADFTRLKTRCRFIAFMPQWDFLDLLAREAAASPFFRLIQNADVRHLAEGEGRVRGIVAQTPEGPIAIEASLVVAADGRHSAVRRESGLPVTSFGVATDVAWVKLSHRPGDPVQAMGHVGPRQGFVMIDRGDVWQCGTVLPKASFDAVKAEGLPAFRDRLAAMAPFPRERFEEIAGWEDVSLLSIRIDRLTRWWKPGLLCIGDAAHAMSPIGGVGVNLAIQDAVAAANILETPLRDGTLAIHHLMAVQARRQFPTVATQALQRLMKRRPKTAGRKPPGLMRRLARFPALAHWAGWLIGVGFRPEHVKPSMRKS